MFMAGLAGYAEAELAMTMRPAPRRRMAVRLEQGGDVLHAAADKRKHRQGHQQEKQKHARRVRQRKQQRRNQDGEYRDDELGGGHALQTRQMKQIHIVQPPATSRSGGSASDLAATLAREAARNCRSTALSPLQPVWCAAPRPRPLSPWKYS